MNFSADKALNYARAIARPRLVGTEGERATADQIAARLAEFGWHVERQPFQFTRAFDIFLPAEIAVGLLLILITLALEWIAPRAAPLPAVGILLVMLFAGTINRTAQINAIVPDSGQPVSKFAAFCLSLGRRFSAANLAATLPGQGDGSSLPHLYLVAHYDSKSQRMPLIVRIALFVLFISGSFIFVVSAVFGLVVPTVVFGIALLLLGTPLVFLDIGNDSPGAIDDASGVGLVLHLAENWSRWPPSQLRVTVLMTSAEEMATMGALAYVRQNESALRRQSRAGGLYVLNFDGVGVDGELYWVGDAKSQFADLIRQVCGELSILLKRFSLFGALFDHIPFSQHGFDAVSLIAISKATSGVHTPRDSVDQLHVRGFEQAGRAAVRVIEKLGSTLR